MFLKPFTRPQPIENLIIPRSTAHVSFVILNLDLPACAQDSVYTSVAILTYWHLVFRHLKLPNNTPRPLWSSTSNPTTSNASSSSARSLQACPHSDPILLDATTDAFLLDCPRLSFRKATRERPPRSSTCAILRASTLDPHDPHRAPRHRNLFKNPSHHAPNQPFGLQNLLHLTNAPRVGSNLHSVKEVSANPEITVDAVCGWCVATYDQCLRLAKARGGSYRLGKVS